VIQAISQAEYVGTQCYGDAVNVGCAQSVGTQTRSDASSTDHTSKRTLQGSVQQGGNFMGSSMALLAR
jgi:hypothetical protein